MSSEYLEEVRLLRQSVRQTIDTLVSTEPTDRATGGRDRSWSWARVFGRCRPLPPEIVTHAPVRLWLEGRARAYELDAVHAETHPPAEDWTPPYPGAPKPAKPRLHPDIRRAVADELRDCARDLGAELA